MSNFLTLLIMVGVAMAPVTSLHRQVYPAFIAYISTVSLCLYVVLKLFFCKIATVSKLILSVYWIFALFVLLEIIDLFFLDKLDRSAVVAVSFQASKIICSLAVVLYCISYERLVFCIKIYLVVACICCLFAIYQFFAFNNFGLPRLSVGGVPGEWHCFRRANSIFNEPSYFVGYLVLALSLLLNSRLDLFSRYNWLLKILIVAGVLCTVSAGGWLFVVVLLCFYSFRNAVQKKSLVSFVHKVFLFVLSAVAVLILVRFLFPLMHLSVILGRLNFFTRTSLGAGYHQVALAAFLDNPWTGVGFRGYNDYLRLDYSGELVGEVAKAVANLGSRVDAHGSFWDIAAESGFPGLLLFGLVFLLMFIATFKVWINNEQKIVKELSLSFILSLLMFIFTYTQISMILAVYFWVFVGLVLAVYNLHRNGVLCPRSFRWSAYNGG